MKTATALTVAAVGAVLAFAVSAEPPGFSFRIAGWVLIATGVIGVLLPRRGYSWLRRRLTVSGSGRAIEQKQRAYSRLLVPSGLLARSHHASPSQAVEKETIEQIIEE